MIRLAAILCWLVLVTSASASTSTGEDRLRAFLDGLHTLSAHFHQVTLSADGGRVLESQGTLYLSRPGRFRWEYQSPTKQVIVADGKRVWLHDIELDQVSHESEDSALAGTPAQLLTSDEPIERHFRILPWNAGDQRKWVELDPKKGDGQVKRIRIGFLGKKLDTLLMEDSFGQITRFTFSDIRRNPKLDKKLFRFDAPIGGDFLEIR